MTADGGTPERSAGACRGTVPDEGKPGVIRRDAAGFWGKQGGARGRGVEKGSNYLKRAEISGSLVRGIEVCFTWEVAREAVLIRGERQGISQAGCCRALGMGGDSPRGGGWAFAGVSIISDGAQDKDWGWACARYPVTRMREDFTEMRDAGFGDVASFYRGVFGGPSPRWSAIEIEGDQAGGGGGFWRGLPARRTRREKPRQLS